MTSTGRPRVVTVIGLVAVVAVVFVALRGGGDAGQTAADPAEGRVERALAPVGVAADASATALLQSAASALEAFGAQHDGSFDGAVSTLPSIEPNVAWRVGAVAAADAGEVAVEAGGAAYVLRTASPSGVAFAYARDATGGITRSCGPGCSW